MLLLDARGNKTLIGICDKIGGFLYKNINLKPSVEVFSEVKGLIDAFDNSFCPLQIGVTVGPGAKSPILQCLNIAKVSYMQRYKGAKVFPIHHIDAHFSFMQKPFLGLIGTSQDTQLVLFDGEKYEILGTDIDLSLGNVYSLTAKALNMQIPMLETFADCEIIDYPVPQLSRGLDFSFAGAYYHTLQRVFPRNKALPKASALLDPCFLRSNTAGMKILASSFVNALTLQVVDRVTRAINWANRNSTVKVLVKVI